MGDGDWLGFLCNVSAPDLVWRDDRHAREKQLSARAKYQIIGMEAHKLRRLAAVKSKRVEWRFAAIFGAQDNCLGIRQPRETCD